MKKRERGGGGGGGGGEEVDECERLKVSVANFPYFARQVCLARATAFQSKPSIE